MANTYYDSQLTAAEIEAALEAVDGLIVPANNGKVIAVENGTLVAKSVSEWTGSNYQSKTVMPGASQQTVTPDSGYDALSSVVVIGDSDLVASNIKKNVEIFGVTGSYEGSGGGGPEPTIPAEYQQVEYLETTNYQYVEVPCQINTGDLVVVVVSETSNLGNENAFAGMYPNGWEFSFNRYNFPALWVSGNSGSSNEGVAMYPYYTPSTTVALGTKFRLAITFTATIAPNKIRVGVYRPDNYAFHGKIYNFAVITNGRGNDPGINLIPCYRKADSKPGFYDLINGVFYTHAGTSQTDFIAGPDVN